MVQSNGKNQLATCLKKRLPIQYEMERNKKKYADVKSIVNVFSISPKIIYYDFLIHRKELNLKEKIFFIAKKVDLR